MVNRAQWHADAFVSIQLPLIEILKKYYRVQGRSFMELDAIAVCKHQSLHLLKLGNKLVSYVYDPSELNRETVINEVLPDLVIYGQELMIKFRIDNWPATVGEWYNDKPLMSFAKATMDLPATIGEILATVSKASAALADVCDQFDHQQSSSFRVENDVMPQLFRAALALTKVFDADIDILYSRRLDHMVAKYESWSI